MQYRNGHRRYQEVILIYSPHISYKNIPKTIKPAIISLLIFYHQVIESMLQIFLIEGIFEDMEV